MSRDNPLTAGRWEGRKYIPPRYLPGRKGHYTAERTREARRLAERVFAGEGTYLGHGNFGVAYRLDTTDGPVLVKIGTRETIHSRHAQKTRQPRKGYAAPRSIKRMRRELQHEAGIANELEALGFEIAPRTTYVEIGRRPVLVREYGRLVKQLTPRQLDGLADQLAEVAEAGFRVKDDLLVAQRPDGSLFVADVGIWQKASEGRMSFMDRPIQDAYTEIDRLAAKQSWWGDQSWPSKSRIAEVRAHVDEARQTDSPLLGWEQARLDKLLTLRDAIPWRGT